MTHIIDGRILAEALKSRLAAQVAQLPYVPRLQVILVGDDPASTIYVRNKTAAAAKIGIASETLRLPVSCTEADLIHLLQQADADGVLVQLPLPPHMRVQAIVEAINPAQDVDGFHPLNVGRVASGSRRNIPCTPKGIMKLLEATQTPLQGVKALVVGCSAIVGRPLSTLLTQAFATVTIAHKLTRNLDEECKRADIIIAAAGCPNLIRGEMIRQGVVIIDVGINRLVNGKLCGDVAFDECVSIASAITPVPGGVGPMTVACLLENTVEAAIAIRTAK